jgi:hypothetical protein
LILEEIVLGEDIYFMKGDQIMAKGLFDVSRDPKNNRDIFFKEVKVGQEYDDEDQLSLRDEIDRTLGVLRFLYAEDIIKFEQYFLPLLSLAELGLSGEKAEPKVAKRVLEELKNEILLREGGRVKNKYMRELGKKAIWLGLPAFAFATVLFVGKVLPEQASFLFLWAGCMAGVWLSFGARKTKLKFEDLCVLEEDRLEPTIRLIFVGLLAIIMGLLIITKVLEIKIGTLVLNNFDKDIRIAFLIGGICGFSETLLPSKIRDQASKIIGG